MYGYFRHFYVRARESLGLGSKEIKEKAGAPVVIK